MKQSVHPDSNILLHVLLADDDRDDRFFFNMALQALPVLTELVMVEDGERLMTYLNKNPGKLPDVLFLDLNMPRKNAVECLSEIKHSLILKDLPVIIYSTSGYSDVSEDLYKKGAHYYFRKTGLIETKAILLHIFNLLIESGFGRPTKERFAIEHEQQESIGLKETAR